MVKNGEPGFLWIGGSQALNLVGKSGYFPWHGNDSNRCGIYGYLKVCCDGDWSRIFNKQR